MRIHFLPGGFEQSFEPGKSILQLAAESGIEIDGNCSGNGTCGKCKVRIIVGNDQNLSTEEINNLSSKEIKDGYRLACTVHPTNDVVVEVYRTEDATKRKTKMIMMPEGFMMNCMFRKEFIHIENATLQDQTADLEKMKEKCGLKGQIAVNADLIRKVSKTLSEYRNVTVTISENEIIDIEPDDTSKDCYGLAVDIGTTTVVGHLWNLLTGELAGVSAVTNPQGVYGADVISRIRYAGESEENLKNIHLKIIDCINEIAVKLSENYKVKINHIYHITVVGNTTMSHLFLGVNPMQLAVAPFIPVFVNGISDSASELGIKINKNAKFHLLPNIAGHVGSDITAGVVSTGIMRRKDNHLMIDVGTNGELVLIGNGKAMTCSTAAGPAFEGASIFKGMRAAEGAIEKVRIDDDVHIKVIGNRKPTGICGSGIIDAVAQLVRSGLIDVTGKFIKPEAMLRKNISEPIISRFRKGEKGNEFVLVFDPDGDDIVIQQKDIREVQLAKAAIFAGINIMMRQIGITAVALDGIHIAGAFGSYIDVDSALAIGLIPKIDKSKIIYQGNTAGIGACMALLSSYYKEEAQKVADSIIHVELAACDEFQEEYLQAMSFSEGDK